MKLSEAWTLNQAGKGVICDLAGNPMPPVFTDKKLFIIGAEMGSYSVSGLHEDRFAWFEPVEHIRYEMNKRTTYGYTVHVSKIGFEVAWDGPENENFYVPFDNFEQALQSVLTTSK